MTDKTNLSEEEKKLLLGVSYAVLFEDGEKLRDDSIDWNNVIKDEDVKKILSALNDKKEPRITWKINQEQKAEIKDLIDNITLGSEIIKFEDEEAPKNKEIVKDTQKSIEQSLDYYKVRREGNPVLQEEYLNMIRTLNGIKKILGEIK